MRIYAGEPSVEPRTLPRNAGPEVGPTRSGEGVHVVFLGGGSGGSNVLPGFCAYGCEVAALNTPTDNGGSSGRLKQLSPLPPGDLRACLAALAAPDNPLAPAFRFRFDDAGAEEGLRGHSLGNLMLIGLARESRDNRTNEAGLFQAIQTAERLLEARGHVFPTTLSPVDLAATMEDGSTVVGETAMVRSPLRILRVRLLPPGVRPPDEAVKAIEAADVIVIGPGSVFTSIIPNLLVRGITEALHRSKARKAYVCNLATQPGETDGFSAVRHVEAILEHAALPIVDYVLMNSGIPSAAVRAQIDAAGTEVILPDAAGVAILGCIPVVRNLIREAGTFRHAPDLVAHAVLAIARQPDRRKDAPHNPYCPDDDTPSADLPRADRIGDQTTCEVTA